MFGNYLSDCQDDGEEYVMSPRHVAKAEVCGASIEGQLDSCCDDENDQLAQCHVPSIIPFRILVSIHQLLDIVMDDSSSTYSHTADEELHPSRSCSEPGRMLLYMLPGAGRFDTRTS
jgi:hypothetical protein